MQSYDDAIQKAKKLAQTPEGQQLIELLKQTGGADMEKALDCAASGNFDKRCAQRFKCAQRSNGTVLSQR